LSNSIFAKKTYKRQFNTICGGQSERQACLCLKQAFYKIKEIARECQRESLTLSDLKKPDVLKIA